METQHQVQDSLSELQAAQRLGITVNTLHKLLDDHIFNNGTQRPQDIRFTHADLLLLSFWCEPQGGKLLRMPKRAG